MTTSTTIEFARVIGTKIATADAIVETVDADVSTDGGSFEIDLSAPGRQACDQAALRALLD